MKNWRVSCVRCGDVVRGSGRHVQTRCRCGLVWVAECGDFCDCGGTGGTTDED